MKKNVISIFWIVWIVVPVSVWAQQEQAAQPQQEQPAVQSASPKEQQDFDFANGLYQRKMYDSAAQKYGEFIKEFPSSPNRSLARFRRGESLYQHSIATGDDPVQAKITQIEAQYEFSQYIQNNPQGDKLLDAHLRFGEISYKLDDAKRGLSSLQRVLDESKDAGQVEAALFYSARCQETLENYPEAEKRYRQVRDTYPKGEFAVFSMYLIAQLYEKTGKLNEAADLLNYLWQNESQYKVPDGSNLIEKTQLLSAQILYRMDRFDEAAKAYEAYINGNPDGENISEAKYGAAWALYRNKNYEHALQVARTLQRETLSPELLAGILFLQGTCSYQQKQYADAVLYFKEVIADPKAGEYRERAWYQLAWSYFLTDQFSDSVRECQNMLQQQMAAGMSSNVHFLLGQSLARLDQLPDAASEMRLVVSIDPNGEYAQDAQYLLGDMLYRLNDFNTSAQEFTKYADTYAALPRAKDALVWAVNGWFAGKEYASAVKTIDRLMEKYPDIDNRQDLLYRKGLAHYQLNQPDDALTAFRKVIDAPDTDQNKAEALYWSAYIYEKKNDQATASKTYNRILEQYPSYKSIADVRLRKAYCDYKTGNFNDAYQQFHTLLFSAKGSDLTPEIVFWLVVQADKDGKHDEALQVVERIESLFGDASVKERAQIAKGTQYVALKQWNDAIENGNAFRTTFKESKFLPEILWSQARGYEGLKDDDKALELYNESLKESQKLGSPDASLEATLYVDRGKVLQRQEKYKEAVESFLRVSILYDHATLTPEAAFHGIECHLALEEENEAQMLYQDLMEHYEDSDWTAKAKAQYASRFESRSESQP